VSRLPGAPAPIRGGSPARLVFGNPAAFSHPGPLRAQGAQGLWATPNNPVGPGAQVCLERVPVHVPKAGVERGCTGGGVGEAERLRNPRAIMASPCGDGSLATRATPHRAARQREDGG
jgi:hypothetical protein